MRNQHFVQFAAICLGAIALFAASRFIPSINDARADLNMLGARSDLQNAPPEYAFAIQAFGAFRSLITDIAFIRADEYKNRGRYYDAMQLAEWICKLQPHFPTVWEFHAWNMSWNISVTTFTPEERWHWVYNGVKLLRDEGIPYNPRAVNLYKQLAWTFFNKMGAYVDDYHLAYKAQWAYRMHLLLGPPPVAEQAVDPNELARLIEYSVSDDPLFRAAQRQREIYIAEEHPDDKELADPLADPNEVLERPSAENPAARARAAMIRLFEEIADAPASLPELYAAAPASRDMVGKLWKLGVHVSDDKLDEDAYWHEDGLAFAFFQPYRQLVNPSWQRQVTDDDDLSTAQLDEILGVSADDPAGRALVRFLQRKVLLEVYKNDPAVMLELAKRFGPMDWRLVDAQAIYWVDRALVRSEGARGDFHNDKMNTMRIMMFSLQNLARTNQFFFDPNPDDIAASYMNFMPDPSFIETMHDAYMIYARRFAQIRNVGAGAGDLFRSGHTNFLSEGIRVLYFAGRIEAAQKYYDLIRELYAYNEFGELETRYDKPLRDYVMDTFFENATLRREVVAAINGMLGRSLHALVAGDSTTATNYVLQARRMHNRFMEDKRNDAVRRHRLEPLSYMYADVLASILMQPTGYYGHTIQKSRIWHVAPLFLQQMVYDVALPQLQKECDAFELDLAKVFPEPPGMDEFRRENPVLKWLESREKSAAETAVQPVWD